MSERDTETGVIQSIERTSDDDGREVLRAVVDFYGGNAPDIKFSAVWDRVPVKIVPTTHAIGKEGG